MLLYLLYELASEGAGPLHALLPLGPEPLETLFLLYNTLAGAALVEEARWGALNLMFYTVAIGLHILSNDRLLAHMAPTAHGRGWRLALGAAPVLGCALALLPMPEGVGYGLLALVAGATILNVIRLELPGPATVRPLWFAGGAGAYALLIFATWRF